MSDLAQKFPSIMFQGEEHEIKREFYQNKRIRLDMVEPGTRIPFGYLTVNVPSHPLEPDEMILRDYGIGKGLTESMVEAGLVTDTGKKAQCGFERASIVKVNEEYLHLLEFQL